MVEDIRVGEDSSYPNGFVDLAGTLYFDAMDVRSYGLWKSDGTEAGTVLVKRLSKRHFPWGLTAVGDTLYFSAYDRDHGYELWRSDGTEAATHIVKDLWEGPNGSGPDRLTVVGDAVFFFTDDSPDWGTPHLLSLWKSDGSRSGTVLLATVRAPYPWGWLDNIEVVGTDDFLFLVTQTREFGIELWRSDGTEAGTVVVKDIVPGRDSSDPWGLRAIEGTVWFTAYDAAHGYELWISDGTEAGTALIGDIWPGQESGEPRGYAEVGGAVYLAANDGVHGLELWAAR